VCGVRAARRPKAHVGGERRKGGRERKGKGERERERETKTGLRHS
jgi:hypothetical protein